MFTIVILSPLYDGLKQLFWELMIMLTNVKFDYSEFNVYMVALLDNIWNKVFKYWSIEILILYVVLDLGGYLICGIYRIISVRYRQYCLILYAYYCRFWYHNWSNDINAHIVLIPKVERLVNKAGGFHPIHLLNAFYKISTNILAINWIVECVCMLKASDEDRYTLVGLFLNSWYWLCLNLRFLVSRVSMQMYLLLPSWLTILAVHSM